MNQQEDAMNRVSTRGDGVVVRDGLCPAVGIAFPIDWVIDNILMPRKKRSSPVLEKTEQRVIGFKSINSNLDFGDSISVNHLTQLTGQLRNQIDEYNMMLTALDSAKAEIETLEKTIRETSERLVSGVAFKYGKDSREYEMTGGVRKSDACGGLRLRIRKATITRLKSTADSKAALTQTA